MSQLSKLVIVIAVASSGLPKSIVARVPADDEKAKLGDLFDAPEGFEEYVVRVGDADEDKAFANNGLDVKRSRRGEDEVTRANHVWLPVTASQLGKLTVGAVLKRETEEDTAPRARRPAKKDAA